MTTSSIHHTVGTNAISAPKKVRVLVVDDSALMRSLITNILSRSDQIEVIAVAVDAQDARIKIKEYNPDVVTLDIEMPGMNGIQFLEKIMKLRPMPVVMCSTLTQNGAQATLSAMRIGAVDYIAKPTENVRSALESYADEMIAKVINAAKANLASASAGGAKKKQQVLSFKPRGSTQNIIAIGSSTGGLPVLEDILAQMPNNCPPILIAQHIAAGFSDAFAKRINPNLEINIQEAQDGMVLNPGNAYIAPGGLHMAVKLNRGSRYCHIYDGEKVNGHKPSVEVLFHSLLDTNPTQCFAAMLTGMGKDGAEAMLALRRKGAFTLAQDEKTSMVWGMPGQVVKLDGADVVLPMGEIAQRLLIEAEKKR